MINIWQAKLYFEEGTPFFVQSGFARPHTPWRVPQRFWDLYDTDKIKLAGTTREALDWCGQNGAAQYFLVCSVTAPLVLAKPGALVTTLIGTCVRVCGFGRRVYGMVWYAPPLIPPALQHTSSPLRICRVWLGWLTRSSMRPMVKSGN
jgi:hypothetical protein